MSNIVKQYSTLNILEISINFLSNYKSQTNLYVKFRYFSWKLVVDFWISLEIPTTSNFWISLKIGR